MGEADRTVLHNNYPRTVLNQRVHRGLAIIALALAANFCFMPACRLREKLDMLARTDFQGKGNFGSQGPDLLREAEELVGRWASSWPLFRLPGLTE